MAEFVHAVQHWERLAFDDPDAPEYHAVYVDGVDPTRIVMLTQFRDEATASRFAAAGLLDAFGDRIRETVEAAPSWRSFALFYGAGPAGTNSIFGEDAGNGIRRHA